MSKEKYKHIISQLANESTVNANLLLETPEVMHALKNGASYQKLLQIINEHF